MKDESALWRTYSGQRQVAWAWRLKVTMTVIFSINAGIVGTLYNQQPKP